MFIYDYAIIFRWLLIKLMSMGMVMYTYSISYETIKLLAVLLVISMIINTPI